MSPENQTLEESITEANRQLMSGGHVVVMHYDLSGFNTWGPPLAERGPEAYEDVMGAGRRVIGELVKGIGGHVRADSGLHDVVDVMIQLPSELKSDWQEALIKLLPEYAVQMRENARGPQARLREYGLEHDLDPLLIVTASPDAHKHRVKLSKFSHLLGSNVPIPGLEGPAVKRATDMQNFLSKRGPDLQGRLFIDTDSAKHLFKIATGEVLGPAEIREVLSEHNLRIGHPPTAGKEPDTFAIYPLTHTQPEIHNFRDKVYNRFHGIVNNKSKLVQHISKAVDTTFGKNKKLIRNFFETELRFDRDTYRIFLEKIIETASDFYEGCLNPPTAIKLGKGDVKKLQENLLAHHEDLYRKQGYRANIATQNAKAEVARLSKELPLSKLKSFNDGQANSDFEYVLRPGEQALMGTIGRDVYSAAVVLALTGSTLKPNESTIEVWTDRVAGLQQKRMEGTAMHEYLANADDGADLGHSDKLHKNDLFEAILQEALLRTHGELWDENRQSIFQSEESFDYFKNNVMSRYVLESSLLSGAATKKLSNAATYARPKLQQ